VRGIVLPSVHSVQGVGLEDVLTAPRVRWQLPRGGPPIPPAKGGESAASTVSIRNEVSAYAPPASCGFKTKLNVKDTADLVECAPESRPIDAPG
jgi:hypothetical protein